jgi:ubiquinone/menaquinone biosynthesis C-methylase UbiE
MVKTFLCWLCSAYQKCFRISNPVEAKLVQLHGRSDLSEFRRAYFEHELEKGGKTIGTFSSLNKDWHGGCSLDFGCGGGGLTLRLEEVSRETTGLDLDENQLEWARTQVRKIGCKNVSFVNYDGVNLPFEDGKFDCIMCVDVVEHLPTLDHFAEEFFRVLKPGGYLLLSFGPPWFHAHGKHMWAKLPGLWTHLIFPRSVVMQTAGFHSDTTWEQLGIFRLSVAKFRRVFDSKKFETIVWIERINKWVAPMKAIPVVRELFIGEVVVLLKKPKTN